MNKIYNLLYKEKRIQSTLEINASNMDSRILFIFIILVLIKRTAMTEIMMWVYNIIITLKQQERY